jgi:hypothetical protein
MLNLQRQLKSLFRITPLVSNGLALLPPLKSRAVILVRENWGAGGVGGVICTRYRKAQEFSLMALN